MERQPPPLLDELVEEILLRFPPDDPGVLVRATLVCKRWCSLISSPRFRRRFREFNRPALMLGFLLDVWDNEGTGYISRFVRTSSCPSYADRRGFALDARHGRVLLYTSRAPREDAPLFFEYDFVVWNPMKDEQKEVPVLFWYRNSSVWNAAVLCAGDAGAGAGACDHLACHDEPFLVVFVGIIMEHVVVYVYSSETGTWSGQEHGHLGPLDNSPMISMGPSLLAEGELHFAIEDGHRILRYDISRRSLSVIPTPWSDGVMGNMGLITAENGAMGVAGVEDYSLHLWSLCFGTDDSWVWKLWKSIEIDTMLSIEIGVPSTRFHVVGFAEGPDTIFICGSDGIYTVAVESGQVKKVHGRVHFFGVVPYVSFYTPGPATNILLPPADQ